MNGCKAHEQMLTFHFHIVKQFVIFLKNISKSVKKTTAYLLLIVLHLHALSIHSFAETLVYCFEENGDVNVESTIDYGIGIKSEDSAHQEENHNHEKSVFHQNEETHKDVPVSLLCSKDDRVNRFDQKKVISGLVKGVFQRSEITPASRFRQIHTFIPPDIEDQETANLQTVVLLN